MIKYADVGIRLPQTEKLLDAVATEFAQKFQRITGHVPDGQALRSLVEKIGGKVEVNGPNGQYDTLNMPLYFPPWLKLITAGDIIVERPFINPNDYSVKGHRVSYDGTLPPMRDYLEGVFQRLHNREVALVKKLFLDKHGPHGDRSNPSLEFLAKLAAL